MLGGLKALYRKVPIEITGLALRLFHAGFTFIIAIILARFMGPESYGEFAYVLSWILFGSLIAQVGLPVFLVREVAISKYENDTLKLNGLLKLSNLIVLGVSIIVTLIIYGVASTEALGKPSLNLLMIGLPSIFFISYIAVNQGIVRGLGGIIGGQLSNLFIRPLSQFLVLAGILILFGFNSLTPRFAIWSLTLSTFAGFVVAFFLKHIFKPTVRHKVEKVEWSFWRKGLLKLSLLNFVTALSTTISVLVLGVLSTKTEVGFYNVCAQLVILLSLGLNVINAQYAPELSEAYAADEKKQLQRLATQASRFSLLIAFPFAILALFFGSGVLTLLFDVGYAQAAPALAILSIGNIFNAMCGSVALILVSARLEHHVVIWQCLGLVFHVILLVILCPPYGAMGAAIAATSSLILWNSALLMKVWTTTGIISLPIRMKAG